MLDLACSPVSPGDATLTEEIHRLTRVTARGLHLPRQAAFNPDTDRGPKGKGRLKRVCGLRRLESPTIERVRRAPARGSGVATTRARRTTPSSFLRAQSAWDYPQGSRLFAHAIDTNDAVTPPTAVSDCLGARAAKNRQQLKAGKGCLGQGVQTSLLAFF